MSLSNTGPNTAVRTWGAELLKLFGKNPQETSYNDYVSTHLGYDTDNGAFYYYHTEPNKDYQDTLLDVHAYAMQEKIPYKHLQIDSWWYLKGIPSSVFISSVTVYNFAQGKTMVSRLGWHNRQSSLMEHHMYIK